MPFNNAVNANTAGIQALTSAGVWNGRTITAGTGISVSNGDGVSGNPTISATGGGSGTIVQQVRTKTSSNTSTTAAIPADNTIPQSSEGLEFVTLTITPTSSSNILYFDFSAFTQNIGVSMVVALFQDSGNNALYAIMGFNNDSGTGDPFSFKWYMTAGTTSSTTFKIRFGPAVSTTVRINPAQFGGVQSSTFTITEVTP